MAEPKPKTEFEIKYDRKKLEVEIMRAKTNIEDYELKIMDRQVDIDRMNTEIENQKKIISEKQLQLKELQG